MAKGCPLPSLRKLPAITTNGTLAKRRHGLVRTPGLRLTIADLFLPALAARQRGRDALLLLRDHGLVHVLLVHALLLGAHRVALHVLVRHDHEALGFDRAVEHVGA